ncbi:hypothetical protein [Haloarchaeobius sp. TZWSO28]|uniref:hypothetical protein n=1 Tax=Haloarchaeobius sp. TZWSO28 TaxID=3446119 RepID=UPI003EB7ECEF
MSASPASRSSLLALATVLLVIVGMVAMPVGATDGDDGVTTQQSGLCLPDVSLTDARMHAYEQHSKGLEPSDAVVAPQPVDGEGGETFRITTARIAASELCLSVVTVDGHVAVAVQARDAELQNTTISLPKNVLRFDQTTADSLTVYLTVESAMKLAPQLPVTIVRGDDGVQIRQPGSGGGEDGNETVVEDGADAVENGTETVDETVDDTTDAGEDSAESANETAENVSDGVNEPVDETTDDAEDTVDDTSDEVGGTVDNTTDEAGDIVENTTDDTTDTVENTTDDTTDTVENTTDDTTDTVENTTDDTTDTVDNTTEDGGDIVENTTDGTTDTVENTTDNTTDGTDDDGLLGDDGGSQPDDDGNSSDDGSSSDDGDSGGLLDVQVGLPTLDAATTF